MISLRKRELELSVVMKDYYKCLNELKKLIYTSKSEQKDLRESFKGFKEKIDKLHA